MANKTSKEKTRQKRGQKSEKATREVVEKSPTLIEKSHSSLLIQLTEEAPTWFRCAKDAPERNATLVTHPPPKPQTADLVEKYRAEADEIYRREVQLFSTKTNDPDAKWMSNTMSKGTLKDRIAAMSVTVSTEPVHRFFAIDGLLQMAGCLSSQGPPNSRVAQLAGEALIDLFLNTLLPSKRKLITLAQRPLHLYESSTENNTKRTISPRILLLWRFEEMVREKYHLFIKKYFGHMLREGNDMQKIPAIRSAAELLKKVPEGEAVLLSVIVNKLGDPAKKVASAASHALRNVLNQHPAMQTVVAREVQQLAHRPHLSDRALYNCITFLNQLTLTTESPDTPVADRLPSSLVQTYFRLFEVAVRVEGKDKHIEEAIAMKGRLLSALLTGVNRAHPYLATSLGELEQHVDSLYRVVHKSPPAACTQALLLLFHLTVGINLVEGEEKDLTDVVKSRQKRFYIALYSRLAQPAMVGTGKHLTLFFNLLYKAMKYDYDKNRVLAFAKRLLCTSVHCTPSVVSASIFLLNEIAKKHPEILHCYRDTLSGRDAKRSFDMREQDPSKAIGLAASGESSGKSDIGLAPCWEMTLARFHYHPTVQSFAQNFGSIEYSGDPLRDFTLATFLDKFAYRNPKSSEKVAGKFSRGHSVAERRSGNDKRIEGYFAMPFNDPAFIQNQNVDVEDQFFHQYFVERAKRDEMKGIAQKQHVDRDEDDEDEGGMDNETDAFDAAEAEVSDFGKYEQLWESDDEEEAFVDSLAQKIIEDSMHANELGPDDLDGEDPDMDDWDDMYSDEEDKKEDKALQVTKGDDSESESDDENDIPNDDAESSDGAPDMAFAGEADDDAFMDNSDDDDDSTSSDMPEPDEEMNNQFGEADQDGEDDDGMGWIDPADDEEDDEEEEVKMPKKKAKTSTATFASLEEYEEQINESWKQVKRMGTSDDDDEEEVQESQPAASANKKKRNKRRKH